MHINHEHILPSPQQHQLVRLGGTGLPIKQSSLPRDIDCAVELWTVTETMNPSSCVKLRGVYSRARCSSRISAPATAEWLLDADAGVLYDSNLNRAYESADIRADGAVTLGAAGGSYVALSGADGLTLTANARSEIYHRFHGLNLLALGGTALYRHKFGLGYAAPWILLAASASHDNYRDDIRDSDRVELRTELESASPSLRRGIRRTIRRRYARTTRQSCRASRARCSICALGRVRRAVTRSRSAAVGVDLAVRRGALIATTRPFQVFVVSDAIAADPTFGPTSLPTASGTTDTAKLTASWALDDRSSLSFAYTDERTDAAGIIYSQREPGYAWRYWGETTCAR